MFQRDVRSIRRGYLEGRNASNTLASSQEGWRGNFPLMHTSMPGRMCGRLTVGELKSVTKMMLIKQLCVFQMTKINRLKMTYVDQGESLLCISYVISKSLSEASTKHYFCGFVNKSKLLQTFAALLQHQN